MRIRILGAVLALWFGTLVIPARGQQYRIDRPAESISTPVHLTLPVEGNVEVSNLPAVQAVRITGGTLDGPVQVQGDLGLRVPEPLLVEVANPPEVPRRVEVDGTVRVDDTQPLQVWVGNFPQSAPPAPRQFAAYAFEDSFTAKKSKARRSFLPPDGSIFHLTDLLIDTRPDAVLKVRVTAPSAAVAGSVAGAGKTDLPLVVLDTRVAPLVRLGTPTPLIGEFALEVEAPGYLAPAAFQVVATGYLEPAAR